MRSWIPRTRTSVHVLLLVAVLITFLPSTGITAATVVAEIKARGKLVAATESDYAPYAYIEDGKLVGYTVDLMQYVARDLGVKLEMVGLPFAGILPGLLTRKFDMVSTYIVMTEERVSRYAFTVPIMQTTFRVLKRQGDSRLNNLNDLSGKVIGVILNSAGERHLRTFDEQLKGRGLPGLREIKTFRVETQAFIALENGELDGVAGSIITSSLLISKRPGVFEFVTGNLSTPVFGSFVVRPDDLDLLESINKTLLKVHRLGVMTELKKKWFGIAYDTPTKRYLPPGAAGREP